MQQLKRISSIFMNQDRGKVYNAFWNRKHKFHKNDKRFNPYREYLFVLQMYLSECKVKHLGQCISVCVWPLSSQQNRKLGCLLKWGQLFQTFSIWGVLAWNCVVRNGKYSWLHTAKPDWKLKMVTKPTVKVSPFSPASLKMWRREKELDMIIFNDPGCQGADTRVTN